MANAHHRSTVETPAVTGETPRANGRGECLSVLSGGRLAIRHAASTELLVSNAILLARSAGNNTLLVTESGDYTVRASLVAVVEQLQTFGLEKIRRGTAVNLTRVRRLESHGQHRLTLWLDDGVMVEVGRTYQRSIRVRLGARTRRQPRSASLVPPQAS